MSTIVEGPPLGRGTATVPASAKEDARRGDQLFLIGCMVCGTWVLGPIGLPFLIVGMLKLRKAERAGAAIRPWSVTIIGGLMLVDAAVNCLAWSTALLWAHDTTIGQTLWFGYGMLADGAYASLWNSSSLGGSSVPGEMAVAWGMGVFVAMPLKIAAAWGLLKMKKWGLQWSIVANWLYFLCWVIYAFQMQADFSFRFGISDFGVLGFWLVGGIPFLGPIVLLPYLHTVNKELWTK